MPYRNMTAEQKARKAAYMRKWQKAHPGYGARTAIQTRDKQWERKYGIKWTDKYRLAAAQGNACAICKTPFKDSTDAHFDHCHKTDTVRGILCRACNTGLGRYEKYQEQINEYLRKAQCLVS